MCEAKVGTSCSAVPNISSMCLRGIGNLGEMHIFAQAVYFFFFMPGILALTQDSHSLHKALLRCTLPFSSQSSGSAPSLFCVLMEPSSFPLPLWPAPESGLWQLTKF